MKKKLLLFALVFGIIILWNQTGIKVPPPII